MSEEVDRHQGQRTRVPEQEGVRSRPSLIAPGFRASSTSSSIPGPTHPRKRPEVCGCTPRRQAEPEWWDGGIPLSIGKAERAYPNVTGIALR